MHEDGADERPRGGTTDGPPSARARADLRADLRREIADARLRFEEAGLRAETHRLLGDDAAAAAVLEEQRQVLAGLEQRLGRAVSAAVLQRDAEEVLAEVMSPAATASPPTTPAPAGEATDSDPDPVTARRVPTLSGVASAVAVLAVAALAVVGVTEAPSRLDVLGAANPASPDDATDDLAVTPSQRPLLPVPAPASTDPDPSEPAPAPTETAEVDAAAQPTSPSPSPDPTPDEPTDVPTEPEFEDLVDGVGDALRRLGDTETEVARPSPDDDPSTEEPSTTDGPITDLLEGPDAP